MDHTSKWQKKVCEEKKKINIYECGFAMYCENLHKVNPFTYRIRENVSVESYRPQGSSYGDAHLKCRQLNICIVDLT